MDGVLVIGLHHGAGESSVAAALAAVARREGERVSAQRIFAFGDAHADALEAFELVASPGVAAARSDRRLEVDALADRLRAYGREGALIASLGGGLMAPLGPRETARDIAVALELAVIFAVKAGPEAANLTRLSLLAARGVRLKIAAVVLTGWPEEEDAVLKSERAQIAPGAGIAVLSLPESPGARAEEVRNWPVAEWLRLRPEPAPAAAPPTPARASAPRPSQTASRPAPAPEPRVTPAELGLDPYPEWESEQPTGDPRNAPRAQIMDALEAIVATEGPVLASRAYALYNRASGGKKLTNAARTPLANAIHWLVQEQRLAVEDDLLRLPDQETVHVRELGSRVLEEVPLQEIAALMERIGRSDPDGLKRAVLDAYGLTRLTQRADDYLQRALDVLTRA